MLVHGLADYKPEVVQQALRVLRGEAVYRSEKALGVAEWLATLQTSIEGKKGPRPKQHQSGLPSPRRPPGFSHVRSTSSRRCWTTL